jgi:chromosome partitioning protein
LLWDLDPQGGSSHFFNCENKNDNTHGKLFDRYISIYDVIHFTDSYQIDVISNDSKFSDLFINKASRITALNFINYDLIKITLSEVEADYDVCILDCSPGRFMLHHNIFSTADLVLVPNTPTPLSLYCNSMIMDEFNKINNIQKKLLSFYNMVEIKKLLHRNYLDDNKDDNGILKSFIPFYTEIESINLNKESIFHQLKESKSITFYSNLWAEICEKMKWAFSPSKSMLVNIQDTQNTLERFRSTPMDTSALDVAAAKYSVG